MSENTSSSSILLSPSDNATTYYDLFVQNHGHTTAMLAIIFIGATISTFGFVLNSLLVLATIKSKRLNTFCHHLIALDALCLALFHFYPLITFLIVLSQVEFVALNVCFFLLFVPQFFINVQYGVMVQIGVERLANILFPIWSLNKKSQKFHLLLLSIYIAFCFALMALQYSELFTQNNMVFCQMADISSRPGLEYSITSVRTLICRSAMIIIYASIFILLKAKNLDSLQSDQKDIYKAVMLIMLVEIVFWVPGTVLNKLFYLFFDFGNIQKTYISAYISTLSLIGSCLNAPILYATSKAYREALSNLLPAQSLAKYPSKCSSDKIIVSDTVTNE